MDRWADWIHHPCRLGGPQQGDRIRNGLHVGVLATSPLPSGGTSTMAQKQSWWTCGRIGYITPTIWGVPNKGTKSERNHMWPDWLHHPCNLGGPPQGDKMRRVPHVRVWARSPLPTWGSPIRGQNLKWRTGGRIGYITPVVWGVRHKGTKTEFGYMWADLLHYPYGWGGPHQGGKIRKGPHVGGLATSPLPSGGSPTRGFI